MTTINQNSKQYKAISIAQLVEMGVKNHYKSHQLGTQKMHLFRDAVNQGLIQVDNTL
jgi:hypothetical protein